MSASCGRGSGNRAIPLRFRVMPFLANVRWIGSPRWKPQISSREAIELPRYDPTRCLRDRNATCRMIRLERLSQKCELSRVASTPRESAVP
eukprot:scaffold226688_cov44-Prasinocladus_malaysianus.AAC.1